MNKKYCVLAFASIALAALPCAAGPLERSNYIKDFAEGVQRSLPAAALTPLSWSDAYIGQLVSLKPHLGAGVSYGMSMADFSSLRLLLADAGAGFNLDTGALMMPPFYGTARLGGFFVPFDIGFAASIPGVGGISGLSLDRQTFSGDIRFAVLQDSVKFPALSIALSYANTKGSLQTGIPSGKTLIVEWSGSAAEIKVQISKQIQAFTPFAGAGGSFTWSRAGYRLSDGQTNEEWWMNPDEYTNGILFRIFGGASVKFWFFRLDMGMNLSITSLDYGASLGLRLQL